MNPMFRLARFFSDPMLRSRKAFLILSVLGWLKASLEGSSSFGSPGFMHRHPGPDPQSQKNSALRQ